MLDKESPAQKNIIQREQATSGSTYKFYLCACIIFASLKLRWIFYPNSTVDKWGVGLPLHFPFFLSPPQDIFQVEVLFFYLFPARLSAILISVSERYILWLGVGRRGRKTGVNSETWQSRNFIYEVADKSPLIFWTKKRRKKIAERQIMLVRISLTHITPDHNFCKMALLSKISLYILLQEDLRIAPKTVELQAYEKNQWKISPACMESIWSCNNSLLPEYLS